jgi:hypothetical protein
MKTVTLGSSTVLDLLTAVEGISKATAEVAQHSAMLAKVCAELLSGAPTGIVAAQPRSKPTIEQCREQRNKVGVNLSPRGIEIIYRLFDHGSSVRGAAIAMDISHRAAKWRKGAWEKAGGKDRPTTTLDID